MKSLNKDIINQLPVNLEFEVGSTMKDINEITRLKKGSIIKLEDSKKDVIRLVINKKVYGEGKALRKNGVMYVELKDVREKGGKKDE